MPQANATEKPPEKLGKNLRKPYILFLQNVTKCWKNTTENSRQVTKIRNLLQGPFSHIDINRNDTFGYSSAL